MRQHFPEILQTQAHVTGSSSGHCVGHVHLVCCCVELQNNSIQQPGKPTKSDLALCHLRCLPQAFFGFRHEHHIQPVKTKGRTPVTQETAGVEKAI